MRTVGIIFVLLLIVPAAGAAADTALLRATMKHWVGEKDHWAFVMEAREFADDGSLKQTRRESYDPTRALAVRRELLTIDGHSPTPAQRTDWQKRHGAKKPKFEIMIADLFNLKNAEVLFDAPAATGYSLPLQRTVWLPFPEKLQTTAVVRKSDAALEHVKVSIRGPFRFALGLARLVEVEIDLRLHPPSGPTGAEPASARPEGNVHFMLSALGKRTDYTYSEFRRVTAAKAPTTTKEPPAVAGD